MYISLTPVTVFPVHRFFHLSSIKRLTTDKVSTRK